MGTAGSAGGIEGVGVGEGGEAGVVDVGFKGVSGDLCTAGGVRRYGQAAATW